MRRVQPYKGFRKIARIMHKRCCQARRQAVNVVIWTIAISLAAFFLALNAATSMLTTL